MDTRSLLAVLVGISTLFLSACGMNVVRGSGHVATEQRAASDFNQVELAGSGEVVVTQGDQESVAVEAEDNLLSHIDSEVRGHTLYLGFRSGIPGEMVLPTRPIIYRVSMKTVAGLVLSGSGDIRAAHVETDQLDLGLTGSGNILVDSLNARSVTTRITGSGNCRVGGGLVQNQSFELGGSGSYTSEKLQSATSTVTITGSGEAVVWAQQTLDAAISGSGTVRYYGTPQVTQRVTGSGTIQAVAMR
jgi:hypothetical protein